MQPSTAAPAAFVSCFTWRPGQYTRPESTASVGSKQPTEQQLLLWLQYALTVQAAIVQGSMLAD